MCDVVRTHGAGDAAAAWIARHQLGLLTTRQLLAAGLGKDAIASRCRRHLLVPIYRGVYLFGQPPLVAGARELGGVLACRTPALVFGRSAASLWNLAPAPTEVELCVDVGRPRSRPGLRVHLVRPIHADDRSAVNGIPVTAPARTLIDFAAGASGSELDRAVSEARVLRLLNANALEAALQRAGARPGVGVMRAFLAAEHGSGFTRSEAERRMRTLTRKAALPPPRCNARVAGWEVDFVWDEHRLVVEVDGFQPHGHRAAFERDRRKGLALVAAGYRVIRITWRQLVHEPLAVAAQLAVALAQG